DGRRGRPGRRLGLAQAAARTSGSAVDALAGAVETHVDVDALIRAAGQAPPLVVPGPSCFPPMPVLQTVTIAVAHDEAFSFYYQDGLDLLESRGARLVSFSPMHDRSLPAVDGRYRGGRVPESQRAAMSETA